MSSTNETRNEIAEHMARAFFATAWSDWADEYGPGTQGNGVDVLDEMPEDLDPAARLAADQLIARLESQHGMNIAEIFERAVEISGAEGDRPKTPEMFGHYAAMGAVGHGVSLYDALGSRAAEFVNTGACYMEFTYFDLDEEKYPIPE